MRTERYPTQFSPASFPVGDAKASSSPPKRALIVSDSRFSSLAVRNVLAETFPDIDEVSSFQAGTDVDLAEFTVIVIVDFPVIAHVTEALATIEANGGDLGRVVVLLRDDQESAVLEEALWRVGAVVPPRVPIDVIAQIANAICDDLSILPSAIVRDLLAASPALGSQTPRLAALTERERHIAQLLATGQSNKHIAASLGISDGTVRVHIRSIVQKLGAANRTQAALLAARGGPSRASEPPAR